MTQFVLQVKPDIEFQVCILISLATTEVMTYGLSNQTYALLKQWFDEQDMHVSLGRRVAHTE